MIDDHAVRRLIPGLGIHVVFTIMRKDDDAVEYGVGGHSDQLLAEAAEIRVDASVPVVRVIGAIPVENVGGRIEIDVVVYISLQIRW